MKDFFSKYKYALALLVIILLGFWAYSSFYPQVGSYLEGPPEPVGEELFEELERIQGITLSDAIFRDQDFLILQDFETEIPPGVAGRENPFSRPGGDPEGTVVGPAYEVVPIETSGEFLNTEE